MAKRGKRYSRRSRRSTPSACTTRSTAVRLIKSQELTRFDPTVEVHLRLGVNVRHADQQLRGTISLPHGTGKSVTVAVFAEGDKAREAETAGADVVGGDDLAKRIQEGFDEFDVAIATPDMMGTVGKLGRILGPSGKMPNPKSGTVTFDVGKAVTDVKARQGRVPHRPRRDHPHRHRQAVLRGAPARSRTTRPSSRRSSASSRRPPRASTSSRSPWPRRWAPGIPVDTTRTSTSRRAGGARGLAAAPGLTTRPKTHGGGDTPPQTARPRAPVRGWRRDGGGPPGGSRAPARPRGRGARWR